MNERLKSLRKHLNLSQDAFGERIGLKGSSISYIESGRSALTEQTLKSICREWNVNESWLRDSNGSMFVELSQSELAARAVGNLLKNDSEFVQKAMIALGSLSPAEWQAVENWINTYFIQDDGSAT